MKGVAWAYDLLGGLFGLVVLCAVLDVHAARAAARRAEAGRRRADAAWSLRRVK